MKGCGKDIGGIGCGESVDERFNYETREMEYLAYYCEKCKLEQKLEELK